MKTKKLNNIVHVVFPDIDDANIIALQVANNINSRFTAQEEANFVAGFVDCIKYLKNSKIKMKKKNKSKHINLKNKKLYNNLKQEHIKDGGKCSDAYAMTALIEKAIKNKKYKLYSGGGYDVDQKRIKIFDVVVWFNFAGDPHFQMCADNSEGDFCELINATPDCKFEKNLK